MHYFYAPGKFDKEINLSKEESHHAFRVMRINLRDKVAVFNGEGIIYQCSVSEINKNRCQLMIDSIQKSEEKRSLLSIAIAPTKNIDRFEWFLEKATEIGVGEIIPVLCEHSERKKIRVDRLEKVLIAAMKQSLNPYLPKLNPLTDLKDVLDASSDCKRFIGHCYGDDRTSLFDLVSSNEKTIILIGPEGDFSENEIKMAKENGWIGVSMGRQRFRTETAGVLATHIYSLK